MSWLARFWDFFTGWWSEVIDGLRDPWTWVIAFFAEVYVILVIIAIVTIPK